MTFREALHSSVEEAALSLGIKIELYPLSESTQDFEIRLAKYPRPNGFGVLVREEYLSWSFELLFDDMSRPLLASMQAASNEKHAQMIDRKDNLSLSASNFFFKINDLPVKGPPSPEPWMNFWLKGTMDFGPSDKDVPKMTTRLLQVLSVPLELLIEETWEKIDVHEGRLEGSHTRRLVNKYERNRFNRAICLASKGFTCRGCDNDMASIYGPLGEGVIHVHHIVPVSKMEVAANLDPINDLVPLCPNCHNIVHRVEPPLPVEELREIIGRTES